MDNFPCSMRTVIINAITFESWSITCFELHFWNIAFFLNLFSPDILKEGTDS